MTVITDRVPLAEISRQAREVRFGRTVLAAVTGVLFGFGWLIAKGLGAVWLILAWAVTAVRLGATHAQANPRPPRVAIERERGDLISEVEQLRAEVKRLTGG